MHRSIIRTTTLRLALWISLLLLSFTLSSCHAIIGDGCFDLRGPTGLVFDGCDNPDTTDPDPVIIQAVSPRTNNSITLEWNLPDDDDDVDQIRITWVSEDGTRSEDPIIITNSNATEYTIAGLNANTAYTFSIVTIDEAGNESVIQEHTATTAPLYLISFAQESYSFTNVQGSSGTLIGRIPVSTPTEAIMAGDTITFEYNIIPNSDDSSNTDSSLFVLDVSATTISILVGAEGIVSTQNYSFTIEATSDQGATATTKISIAPPDTLVPVTMLTAAPAGNEVTLNWVDSSSDGAERVQITWEITGSGTSLATQTARQGDQTATIGGLTSETTYTFSLIVEGDDRTSSPAVTIDATTLDISAPPQVPSATAIPDANGSTMELTWTDPVATDLAHIEVTWRRRDGIGVSGGPMMVNAGVGGATITGLTSETAYIFTLVAVDNTGNRSRDFNIIGTTPDITAPTEVTMLAAVPAGNEVMLTWVDSASSDATRVEITWEITGSGMQAGDSIIFDGVQSATISGLTSETEYTFSLIVEDDAGMFSPAVTIDVTTLDITAPPEVPSATATPDANGSTMVLTWADPAATDLAHIALTWRRSDNTGVSGGPIQVNPTVETATITGLTSETAYTFTLVAVDADGNRSRDFSVTGTTADITAPTAATGLTANAVDATVNVDLVWTPSNSDDVATVTIEWTTAAPGVDGGSIMIDPITTTSTTITGLAAATLYTFVIHTADAAGNSRSSTTASVTTNTPPDLTPPAAVTITTAVAVANSSDVDLTWSTPAPDVDTTTVRWALASAANTNIGSMTITPSTTTTATITSLNAATAYVFTVRVADAAGNINDSPSRTVTTNTPPDTTAPNSVDMVTSTPAANSITLSWRASSSADAAIVDITWAPNHGGGTTGVRIAHTSGRQSTIITGLNSDIPYSFTLITEDAAGNRSVPLFHTDTTLDNIDPNPISSFSAQPLTGGTSIELTWTDSGSDDAASVHITWTPVGTIGAAGIRIAQGTQTATITGLISDTQYTFSAVVEDEVPNTSRVITTTTRTLDITAPDPVDMVSHTATGTSVTLSWSASSSSDADMVHIIWTPNDGGGTAGRRFPHTVGSGSATITGLNADTPYFFTLFTEDAAGNRSTSPVFYPASTLDTVKPNPISGFSAQPLANGSSIELTWTDSGSDDAVRVHITWTPVGAAGAAGVRVAQGIRTATIADLISDTEYTFSAVVQDEVPNTSSVVTTTTTTLDVIDPDPISNLRATTTAGTTDVTLSWDDSLSPDATTIRIRWRITGSGGLAGTRFIPHGSTNTTTISSLVSETEYRFTFVVFDDAVNLAGNPAARSSSSVSENVITADITSPAAVSDFTALPPTGATAVTLSWTNSGSADAANLEIAWTSTTPGITPGSETIPASTGTGTSTHTVTGLTRNTPYAFTITVIDGANNRSVVRTATPVTTLGPVDADGDGLIDISSLDQLNNMRHNRAGTSYKTSSADVGTPCGTDATIPCTGYELTQNLDFASASSYDSNSINATWRPTGGDPDTATNAGWEPIGDATDSFATVFEGNGYTISNLYIRRTGTIGLFGVTNSAATIRNIGIINNASYGSTGRNITVGGLVGWNIGTISASYATGTVDGGGGASGRVGGLVGDNDGTITASYATGDVDGGAGAADRVGGLVGE